MRGLRVYTPFALDVLSFVGIELQLHLQSVLLDALLLCAHEWIARRVWKLLKKLNFQMKIRWNVSFASVLIPESSSRQNNSQWLSNLPVVEDFFRKNKSTQRKTNFAVTQR